MKIRTDHPVGSVNSVRVIAHRANRLQVILRAGRPKKNGGKPGGKSNGGTVYTLIGGKNPVGVLPRDHAEKELEEELGLPPLCRFRHETVLSMPERKIWCSLEEYQQLGFDYPGQCEPEDELLISNPLATIFSVQVDGVMPKEREGRKLIEVNLERDDFLDHVKPRYQAVLRAWRDLVVADTSMPRSMTWTANND